jgi:hypothetical protein
MTDSPWFWAYLFGTGALIALAMASPKFSGRQTQEEQKFQGRERAAQYMAGAEMTGEVSTEDDRRVTLRPLFIGMAAITTIAWVVFWTSRRRAAAAQDNGSPASGPPPSPPRGHDSSRTDSP